MQDEDGALTIGLDINIVWMLVTLTSKGQMADGGSSPENRFLYTKKGGVLST